jgi:hypothetical protein
MPSSSVPGHPHNQKEMPGYLAKYVNILSIDKQDNFSASK